eukprot:1149034-Pelagomonas_calceolata.AAC.3
MSHFGGNRHSNENGCTTIQFNRTEFSQDGCVTIQYNKTVLSQHGTLCTHSMATGLCTHRIDDAQQLESTGQYTYSIEETGVWTKEVTNWRRGYKPA